MAIIGIFSGKGGVGKTTISINLAIAATKLGHKTIVVDGDIKNPNISIVLGDLLNEEKKTINDILLGRSNVIEAINIHDTGLMYIPADISMGDAFMTFELEVLKNQIEKLPYDLIIDTPPGMSNETLKIMKICDYGIIVSEPLLPDVVDNTKISEVAINMGIKILGIILNKVRNKDYELNDETVEKITKLKIIGKIPYDEQILYSLKISNPIVSFNPYAKSSIKFFEIASKIFSVEYKKPKLIALKSLFNRFFNSRYK